MLYVIAAPFPANELAEDLCELGLAPSVFGACPERDAMTDAGLEYVTADITPEVAATLDDLIGDVLCWPAGDADAMHSATEGVLS